MFLVTGDAGTVGAFATLCVKGKQERLALRLYTPMSGSGNCRLGHKNATHGRTELKHVGNG